MSKYKRSQIGLKVATVAGALVLFSGSAFATAIGSGTANTGGTVNVSFAGIQFSNFTAPGPNSGAYAGTTGVTQNPLLGTATLSPNAVDFTTFIGPGIMFDLQTINAGFGTGACTGTAADVKGNTCTPSASSGITLTQSSSVAVDGVNSVSITFSGKGIAYTGTSASGSTPTSVIFTSQNLLPGTISDIIAAVGTTGGFTDSVSATYVSTSSVPEPMTLSMMGIGLLGLGLVRRRKKS